MKIWLRILLFSIGILLFALIRLYENELFNDPLIEFYKNTFQQKTFPDLDFLIYTINLGFRYVLNTIISIGLIWVLFKNSNYIKFSALLYLFLFGLGIIAFWIIARHINSDNLMPLFYVRRFLIQPLLVVILIPAFYFQNATKS